MNALALSKAIESSFKNKRLTDAFDAIVEAYYEEYTDADDLDPDFRSDLESVFNTIFPLGTDDDLTFDDLALPRSKLPRT